MEIHKGVSECLNVVSKVCGPYESHSSPPNEKTSLALGNLRTACGGERAYSLESTVRKLDTEGRK